MRRLRRYLYQGDNSDLPFWNEKAGVTLAVNVGHLPMYPAAGKYMIHSPMMDLESPQANNWLRIGDVLRLAVKEVECGGVVFVACDVGASRSVVFSGMVIAAVEHRRMDARLLDEIRSPIAEPLPGLWRTAKAYVEDIYGGYL